MQNRRKFLKKTLLGIGSLPFGVPLLDIVATLTSVQNVSLLRQAQAAAPAGKVRRHLINLSGYGGWDSSLFHNGIPIAPFEQQKNDTSVFLQGDVTAPLASFLGFDRNNPAHYCLSSRCSDANGTFVSPINGGSHFLAGYFNASVSAADFVNSGSKSASGFFKKYLTIWKGIQKQGEHGVGNFAINQGTSAAYAKSYSSIVAQSIAVQDYVRPLHHVAVSSTSSALSISTTTTLGYETPTYIPDMASFTQMTSNILPLYYSAGSGAAIKTLRNDIETAVLGLTKQALAPQLKAKASQTSASTYLANYSSSKMLSYSNYAACGEFLGLQIMYAAAIVRAQNAVIAIQPPVGAMNGDVPMSAVSMGDAFTATTLALYGAIKKDLTQLILKNGTTEALNAADANILAYLNGPGAGQYSNFTSMANLFGTIFQFALTDFLIRNDLSAVVSVGFPCGDPHYQWSKLGLASLHQSYACMAQLIANLDSVSTGVSGNTLLDSTLVIMHTEMDRWPFLEGFQGGTNHGPTASVLLAGYGVKRGAVVGGIALDPTPGAYAAYDKGKGLPTCFTGLPIDSASGLPKPGGDVYSVHAILPTICAIFGATVPLSQITEAVACPAVKA